jgi:hypothetical protein
MQIVAALVDTFLIRCRLSGFKSGHQDVIAMEAFADLPIVALCDCHELSLLPVVAEVGK